MHIVIATAHCQADSQDEMHTILSRLTQQSADDDGLQSYEFLVSIDDPTRFRSIEMWDSAEAVRDHMGLSHVQTALAELGPLFAGPPSIISYDVAEQTTLT